MTSKSENKVEDPYKKIRSQIIGESHDPSQWNHIIDILTGQKYYAYIFHDRDMHDDGTPVDKHLHFVCEGRHNMYVWSELLSLPLNFIEWPKKSWRNCNRYLIHLDDPEKFLYNPSDVFTNKPIKFESYLQNNDEISPKVMFYDIAKIKQGRLSVPDFIDKYQFDIL